MLFKRHNYRYLFVSLFLIFTGYTIMAVAGDVFSFYRLTLAPLLIIAGHAGIMFSIMQKAPGKIQRSRS